MNSLTEKKFESDCIHTLMEDSGGNLWIGTRQGVYILDADDQFHKLSEWMPVRNWNSFIHVSSILRKMRNGIWIATNYEGIVRINLQDKTYKRFTP